MATTMVVRMQRVAGVGGALGSHIDGKTRPESAAPRTVHVSGADIMLEPVVHLDEEGNRTDLETVRRRRQDAQSHMERCRQKATRGGRKPMGAVTFMFAGPPRYDGENDPGKEPPWDQQTVEAWAADVVKLTVQRAGPGSRLAECELHQDEGAPHLHLSMVVADEEGRLGWNRVRERFVPRDFELARGAKRRTIHESKRLMSGLQDVYYEGVGRKYGLGRGEVGSDREHAPVDRAKGIQIRVEEERRRAGYVLERAGKQNARVMEREEAVGRRERAFSRREQSLEDRKKAVRGHEKDVRSLEKGVRERERAFSRREQSHEKGVREHERAFSRREQSLERREEAVRGREEAVGDREEAVSGDREKEIRRRQRAVGDREKEIRRRQRAVRDREKAVSQQEVALEQVSQREAALERREAAVTAKLSEAGNLAERVIAARRERDEARRQLKAAGEDRNRAYLEGLDAGMDAGAKERKALLGIVNATANERDGAIERLTADRDTVLKMAVDKVTAERNQAVAERDQAREQAETERDQAVAERDQAREQVQRVTAERDREHAREVKKLTDEHAREVKKLTDEHARKVEALTDQRDQARRQVEELTPDRDRGGLDR